MLTKLGALLEGDGHTIETINTGRNGANTVDQRDLFRDRGLQYDPDLIILFYVLNDVEQHLFEKRPKIEFFTNYTSLYQEADWLSNYSYFWGWAFQRFHATYTARQYVKQSVDTFLEDNTGWEQSRRALEEINQLAMAHGAPLLVVIFPFFTASTENMLFRSYTMRCEAIVNAPEFRSWTFATATVVTKVQNSGYTQLTNTQMRSPMRSQRTPLQSI